MSESEVGNSASSHTRPYTVGVSIAVVLIFLIALLHLWSFIFKKIKKRLNSTDFEVIETEIPVKRIDGRKISSSCIQHLDMILKYEDEVDGEKLSHNEFRTKSLVNKTRKFKSEEINSKSRSASLNQKTKSSQRGDKIIFFAGYSHQHNNET